MFPFNIIVNIVKAFFMSAEEPVREPMRRAPQKVKDKLKEQHD